MHQSSANQIKHGHLNRKLRAPFFKKGEEKSTTYLNRLAKQFHLSPLACHHTADGMLIIINANCLLAASWLLKPLPNKGARLFRLFRTGRLD